MIRYHTDEGHGGQTPDEPPPEGVIEPLENLAPSRHLAPGHKRQQPVHVNARGRGQHDAEEEDDDEARQRAERTRHHASDPPDRIGIVGEQRARVRRRLDRAPSPLVALEPGPQLLRGLRHAFAQCPDLGGDGLATQSERPHQGAEEREHDDNESPPRR